VSESVAFLLPPALHMHATGQVVPATKSFPHLLATITTLVLLETLAIKANVEETSLENQAKSLDVLAINPPQKFLQQVQQFLLLSLLSLLRQLQLEPLLDWPF